MDTLNKTYIRQTYQDQQPVPVLHIIKSLGRGGAEMLLPETLRQHDKQKYDFHYMYFLPWKNQMVSAIEEEGGKVVCIPAKNNAKILLAVRRIAAYVRKHNIQLIHCHLPWAGMAARIVGRMTGVPVVYTEHNKWERYHKLTYLLNKFTFGSQQRVIAVSAEVANSIKTNYGKAKPLVQVVANGTDTLKYSRTQNTGNDIRAAFNIPPTATVIGITCVFRAQKRLGTWLEIAQAVHAKDPNTFFIIVGDGPLKEEIHAKAKTLGTDQYVFFAGLQTETRPYFAAMDIFMMSSEFEGLPIALLEAMSMNCVPACTAAGGIPEVIKDSENGVLVPVQEPMQLVERLLALIQQPAEVTSMKQAARETVINAFSMKKMVGELETIYNDLITK
ncbi:glycosyl transferase family 1 [Niastella yeongjuensis]|uniref:Glycosyl transferase family 1 n=1 Tax=Niastella yeongjuensis TaxID=354355 RepID=A0A1V9EMI1_9BACT|nr:glycosyltransferase [Niastella yeongjuensis]OQP47358.1 glycosyl transferase family 1 [Niastella yeongjuensis]SEN80268.1 Glycosyltransferase involved in cell wall bisynthesis [Niastella yeongjuensis]